MPWWAPYSLFNHKRVAQEPKFNLLGSLLARGLSGETLDISNRMYGAAQSCFPIIRLQMNLRTMTIQVVGRRLSLSAPTSTILYSWHWLIFLCTWFQEVCSCSFRTIIMHGLALRGSCLTIFCMQFFLSSVVRPHLITKRLPTADFSIARRKLWWIWTSFFRWYRSCLWKQD